MKNFIKNRFGFLRKLISLKSRLPYPVTVLPREGKPKKWALLSYLSSSLLLPDNSPILLSHSNTWECREIGRILLDMGYGIDAINWDDMKFVPKREYDVVFDICYNLARLSDKFGSGTIRLLHCTGSDPYYQNAAEMKRVEAVNKRRNGKYHPKRLVLNPELSAQSIEIADHISLFGNQHTLNTYPENIKKKTTLVQSSGSVIGENRKNPDQFIPSEKEFLWFFGSGAVHKGLDLVLEVFATHPEYTLNIVGAKLKAEPDFIEMYQKELYELPNIHYHGFLLPSGIQFREIINRTFCFIAPSCSEGISPAVTTCLQIGLFPIISADTGVDLPSGCGILLENCTIDEIERAVLAVYNLSDFELNRQIWVTQTYAANLFSRDRFHSSLENYLSQCLLTHAD